MAVVGEERNIEKLRAEVNKIIVETAEINQRTRWYLLVVGTALATGLITMGKMFF